MTTILPLRTENNQVVATNSTEFYANIEVQAETAKALQIEILFVSTSSDISSSRKFWIPKSLCLISQEGVSIKEWFINKEIMSFYLHTH